jgi:hypothetical protein
MARKLIWWAEPNLSLETDFDTDSGRLDDQRARTGAIFPIAPIDTFVRESIQNSKDQGVIAGSPVLVRLRVRELSSAESAAFESHADPSLPRRHYDACVQQANQLNNQPLKDEFRSRRSDRIERLLYVEDFRTRGLTGPVTFDIGSAAVQGGANFSMLLLSRGATEAGAASRGGSWGFGKSVYWAASQLKCCIFYSQFIDERGAIVQRIAGRSRLVLHRDGQSIYTGVLVGGAQAGASGRDFRPIEMSDLRELAKQLGFSPRDPAKREDCGTSVCILNPQFREQGDKDVYLIPEAADLSRSIAMYYWPALCPCGGHPPVLEVEVVDGKGKVTKIEPAIYPFLEPFLEGAAIPANEGYWHVRDIRDFGVRPIGTSGQKREAGRIVVAIREWSGGSGPFEDSSKLALIRGSRMVVGYYDVPFKRERQMAGVVLAGLALNEVPSAEVQADLEQWLKCSESAAHDSWSDESRNLPRDRGAKAQIQSVHSTIKETLKEIFVGDSAAQGSGALELERLLKWRGAGSEGGTGGGGRGGVSSRRALSIDYPSEVKGWQAEGRFEVDVRIGWSAAGLKAQSRRVHARFGAVLVDDRDVATDVAGARVVGVSFLNSAQRAVTGVRVEQIGDSEVDFELPDDAFAWVRVVVDGASRFRNLGVQLEVATEAEVLS